MIETTEAPIRFMPRSPKKLARELSIDTPPVLRQAFSRHTPNYFISLERKRAAGRSKETTHENQRLRSSSPVQGSGPDQTHNSIPLAAIGPFRRQYYRTGTFYSWWRSESSHTILFPPPLALGTKSPVLGDLYLHYSGESKVWVWSGTGWEDIEVADEHPDPNFKAYVYHPKNNREPAWVKAATYKTYRTRRP